MVEEDAGGEQILPKSGECLLSLFVVDHQRVIVVSYGSLFPSYSVFDILPRHCPDLNLLQFGVVYFSVRVAINSYLIYVHNNYVYIDIIIILLFMIFSCFRYSNR